MNKNLVLTFDELLRRTPLAQRMTRDAADPGKALPRAGGYRVHRPRSSIPPAPSPEVEISLLQCRPQSHLKESEARLPQNLNPEDIIFSTPRMAPEGRVSGIRYVLFVTAGGLLLPCLPRLPGPSWAG